jgi:hypothetical protein
MTFIYMQVVRKDDSRSRSMFMNSCPSVPQVASNATQPSSASSMLSDGLVQ